VLNCRLAVAHFSGGLPLSIRPNFLARVWLRNLLATFAYLARERVSSETRRLFLPNPTCAMIAVKVILPRLVPGLSHPANALGELHTLIARTLEWRRPGRGFPRNRQAVTPPFALTSLSDNRSMA